MSAPSDERPGLDPAVLESAGRVLDGASDGAEIDEGRRAFLEGLRALREERLEEATRRFRRAAREAAEPFDVLARVARAECERVRGKLGVALREWREVARDHRAPRPVRYMAWLSVAAAARDRSDKRMLARAREAIERLETSEGS